MRRPCGAPARLCAVSSRPLRCEFEIFSARSSLCQMRDPSRHRSRAAAARTSLTAAARPLSQRGSHSCCGRCAIRSELLGAPCEAWPELEISTSGEASTQTRSPFSCKAPSARPSLPENADPVKLRPRRRSSWEVEGGGGLGGSGDWRGVAVEGKRTPPTYRWFRRSRPGWQLAARLARPSPPPARGQARHR